MSTRDTLGNEDSALGFVAWFSKRHVQKQKAVVGVSLPKVGFF